VQRLGKVHSLFSKQKCGEQRGRPALAHMTMHEHRAAARQGVTDERVAPLEVVDNVCASNVAHGNTQIADLMLE
jgi:hypothetical protein